MKKLLLGALAALFFQTGASANVLYEWQYTNDLTPFNMVLWLTLSDEAAARGSINLDTANPVHDSPTAPGDGLLEFHYEILNTSKIIHYDFGTKPLGDYDILRANLLIGADGSLSGKLYANNSESHIGLEGPDGTFLVTTANSDQGMGGAGCWAFQDCHGATGFFQRTDLPSAAPADAPVDLPADVPEPGSLALMGLALAGLAVARSRKA